MLSPLSLPEASSRLSLEDKKPSELGAESYTLQGALSTTTGQLRCPPQLSVPERIWKAAEDYIRSEGQGTKLKIAERVKHVIP